MPRFHQNNLVFIEVIVFADGLDADDNSSRHPVYLCITLYQSRLDSGAINNREVNKTVIVCWNMLGKYNIIKNYFGAIMKFVKVCCKGGLSMSN